MIRIDPAKPGKALVAARGTLGIGRLMLAGRIADATGRTSDSVSSQIAGWELGVKSPTFASLGPLLDALGYDLALIPREREWPGLRWSAATRARPTPGASSERTTTCPP